MVQQRSSSDQKDYTYLLLSGEIEWKLPKNLRKVRFPFLLLCFFLKTEEKNYGYDNYHLI